MYPLIEKEEEPGVLPLYEESGQPPNDEGVYEEGTALALHPCDVLGSPGAMTTTTGVPPTLHVDMAKSINQNSCPVAAPHDAVTAATGNLVAIEKMPTSCPGPEKRSELSRIEGLRLGQVGNFLQQKLLEVFPLRSQSTGDRNPSALFPLPTSRASFLTVDPTLNPNELAWGQCLTLSLNSFWGAELFNEREPTKCQVLSLQRLFEDVRRFVSLHTAVETVNWDEFFKIKSIDYKGDEVKVARWFSWSNVSPALPREVGRVPLEEVTSHGAQHYVLNFDHYLKPRSEWGPLTKPRVMVSDEDWGEVCKGLVDTGVCTFIEEHEVFDTGEGPLLNGLFGVTKDEWTEAGVEIYRLIMNLVPLNSLCRPLSGDVDTLPSWSGMNPYFLQPSQGLLVSSEDVKCFFYVISVPSSWTKYLAFNKMVPDEVLPSHLKSRKVYIASRVLPMGFLNSVSLAQHVHRTLVLGSGTGVDGNHENPPEKEHRKDRPLPHGSRTWRVYLCNYDLLEKVEATEMVALEGTTSPGVLALRHQYEAWEVPRNLKKAVARSSRCELQGATVDGRLGVAFPREAKLSKYFSMALALCLQSGATQKQWQVVCGGLVYFTMFRKPLLGTLNRIWQHIEEYNSLGCRYRHTPADCYIEILRFLGCLPLARLDFRLGMHPLVTCSDASDSGGGVCVSRGTTPFGHIVANGALRGEVPESRTSQAVFAVGLFDGIGALRVALDAIGVQVLGYVSAEKAQVGQRVVETHFPGVIVVKDVQDIDAEMVKQWSTQFSQCTLVLLGAGPPCQGVSGLNADRLGALRDGRSNLFVHVPRIRELLRQHFVWCPVHTLMESVASMDKVDRATMSAAVDMEPLSCDAGGFTCPGKSPHLRMRR